MRSSLNFSHAYYLNTISTLLLTSSLLLPTAQAAADDRYTLSLNPLPAITRDDGEVSAKFIGFLQTDAMGQDAQRGEQPSGTTVRRARLGLAGKASANWGYKWVYEFAGPKAELQDAFITYQSNKRGLTLLGQHKDPVGLEWQSAAKYWTFHELPLLTALTPRRAIGVSHRLLADRWRLHAGIFGENHSQARSDNEGYSASAHVAWTPMISQTTHWHIGGSFRHQQLNAGNHALSLKAKHETSVTDTPLLKTPSISGLNSSRLTAVEFLWLYQQWLLQGEMAHLALDNPDSYSASSGYLQAAWMLRGDGRQFNRASHAFKRVTVKKTSAIELALRAEILDLNTGLYQYGQMTKYSVAANWHLSNYVKLSLNASVAKTDEFAATPNERVNSLGLRAQLDF